MALVAASFISLVGFYIVKNAIERDHLTRVGEILAATPLIHSAYLVGKWLSNTAVLAAQVVILALASIVMQFVVWEDSHLDLWALLAPFLLLALPTIAVTGAIALLFETLPILRGGIGNVMWVFAWGTLTALERLDFTGLFTVMASMTRASSAAIPGYDGGFALQITLGRPHCCQWPPLARTAVGPAGGSVAARMDRSRLRARADRHTVLRPVRSRPWPQALAYPAPFPPRVSRGCRRGHEANQREYRAPSRSSADPLDAAWRRAKLGFTSNVRRRVEAATEGLSLVVVRVGGRAYCSAVCCTA